MFFLRNWVVLLLEILAILILLESWNPGILESLETQV